MTPLDRDIAALRAAAEAQFGPEPSVALRGALSELADAPERGAAQDGALEVMRCCTRPCGAAYIAVWFGAAVEDGRGPDETLGPIVETFIAWTDRVGAADAPADLADALNLFGNALVAHLILFSDAERARWAAGDLGAACDRGAEVAHGPGWVSHALAQASGPLTVLVTDRKLGFRLSYSSVANCFHLFTLIQDALREARPRRAAVNEAAIAVARRERWEPVEDAAWWHYGQPSSPLAAIGASVWGEASPRSIERVDGAQTLLLWPPLLGSRTWDGGFFRSPIDATRPFVTRAEPMSAAEVAQLWDRLALPEPEPSRGFRWPWSRG